MLTLTIRGKWQFRSKMVILGLHIDTPLTLTLEQGHQNSYYFELTRISTIMPNLVGIFASLKVMTSIEVFTDERTDGQTDRHFF